MKQSLTKFIVRNFQSEDMPLLGELYQSVSEKDVVFWWVKDEDNWSTVYCAFEDGKMIAKGQVSIVNIMSPGRPKNTQHSRFYVDNEEIRYFTKLERI